MLTSGQKGRPTICALPWNVTTV